MASNSQLPLSTSLYAQMLNMDNPMEFVINSQPIYNSPTLAIIAALNAFNVKKVDSELYSRSYVDNLSVAAPIQQVEQVGSDLKVTLADNSYDSFRNQEQVADSNGYKAYVKSHSPGILILEPFTSGALNAATHFVKDSTVSSISIQATSRASGKTESLYVTPKQAENVCNTIRDTVFLASSDLIATKVKFMGASWAHSQETFMLRRLMASVSTALIENEFAFQKQTSYGKVNSNGGLLWSIANRGGIVDPITDQSQAISIDFLNDMILRMQAESGKELEEVSMLGGGQAIKNAQMAVANAGIVQSGVSNTFGGTMVEGFDVPFYKIAGTKVKFIRERSWDNPGKYSVSPKDKTNIPGLSGSKKSNSFCCIDTSSVESVDGQKDTNIELFTTGKELSYGTIKGMLDTEGGTFNETDFLPTNTDISSDIDGRTVCALVKLGLNIPIANGMYHYKVEM